MLSHYRVLDLTDDRGHFAGFLLAQLGADVIAVEPPFRSAFTTPSTFANGEENPESSLQHWAYNRGKRSVVLSTAQQLLELARTADVLIECGAMNIDLDALRGESFTCNRFAEQFRKRRP